MKKAFMDSTRYSREQLKFIYYWIKFGDVCPRPTDVLHLNPSDIRFTFPSNIRYDTKYENFPKFGIVSGNWDQYVKLIEYSVITRGLREHFEDGKEWIDTIYYQKMIDQLKQGDKPTTIGAHAQTEADVMEYLKSLDSLYKDLKLNGFRPVEKIGRKNLPQVHIGRDGECILTHGHHRTILCVIINMNSIPYAVGVRHSEWQKIRFRSAKDQEVCLSNMDMVEQFGSPHPDLKDLLSEEDS